MGAAQAPMSNGAAQGSYVGEVKSFNPQSGWGHITCAQTEQMYGKDMFFMKSALPGGHVQKGATVQFSVIQGQKGPEAQNMVVLGLGSGCMSMPMGTAGCKGWGASQTFHGHGPGMIVPPASHMGKAPAPMAAGMNAYMGKAAFGAGAAGGCGGCGNPHSVYFGMVKSFREDKGWGHISCPQTEAIYGKDMFVMRSALNGNTISDGDNVQFSVTLGLKGPEATNVRVMGQIDEQQLYTGSVKMFNQEKGWGFITCEETKSMFGKDIFMHKKELANHVPAEGESVQFQVQMSPEGRPEGVGLNFGAAAGPVVGAVAGCGGYVAWKGAEAGVEQESWSYPPPAALAQRALRKGGVIRPGPYA